MFFFSGVNDPELAYTKKQNWREIIETMKSFFAENPQTYKQSLDCEKLLFEFSKVGKNTYQ